MSKKRYIYRDYRKGKAGRLTKKESYNRSRAQGVECNIHKELISKPSHKKEIEPPSEPVIIDNVDDLFDYQDYEGPEDIYDIQGTGDTGRSRE